MMRYGLIGCGYVASKHLDAIKHVGGELVAACSANDVAGMLDAYSPNAKFELWHPLDTGNNGLVAIDLDCVAICTPNDSHVDLAVPLLEQGKHVIIEKPIALSLAEAALLTGYPGKVHPVCQLRDHPDVLAYPVADRRTAKTCNIRYTVWRGPWYDVSWKGNEAKSGGLLSNIGIHLFDLAIHMFGDVEECGLISYRPREAVGWLKHEQGTETRWHLSLDSATSRRVFDVDGGAWRLDLSDIAKHHLHRVAYVRAVSGRSWALDDVLRAVRVIEELKGMR